MTLRIWEMVPSWVFIVGALVLIILVVGIVSHLVTASRRQTKARQQESVLHPPAPAESAPPATPPAPAPVVQRRPLPPVTRAAVGKDSPWALAGRRQNTKSL